MKLYGFKLEIIECKFGYFIAKRQNGKINRLTMNYPTEQIAIDENLNLLKTGIYNPQPVKTHKNEDISAEWATKRKSKLKEMSRGFMAKISKRFQTR